MQEKLLADIRQFMVAADQTIETRNVRQMALYTGLQFEELAEKVDACGFHEYANELHSVGMALKEGKYDEQIAKADPVKLLDADLDLAWVSLACGYSMGAHMTGACNELGRSNLDKVGPDGKMQRDENGKVMKPDGYKGPDFAPFLPDYLTEQSVA